MDANQDILQGQWPALKGQVKQQWGKLTDDDLRRLSGKTEELAGVLQQRYGLAKLRPKSKLISGCTPTTQQTRENYDSQSTHP